jgi:hypothetical protein
MVSLAAALLLAAPADDAGTHLGIVAGAGGAENLLGAHLQLRHDHLAVFLGTGLPMLTGSWSDGYHYAAVIGGRWYSGLGDRFFVSAQLNFLAWQQLIVHDELGGREILTPFQGYAFTIVGDGAGDTTALFSTWASAAGCCRNRTGRVARSRT